MDHGKRSGQNDEAQSGIGYRGNKRKSFQNGGRGQDKTFVMSTKMPRIAVSEDIGVAIVDQTFFGQRAWKSYNTGALQSGSLDERELEGGGRDANGFIREPVVVVAVRLSDC